MPTVSILIPAYKAEYLERAIISAQLQTFEDTEILVGDDTPDGKLEGIVKRFNDPRIRYFHHGFQKGTRNARALWHQAAGRYVKWLFDDDVLMPGSVQALVSALQANPQSVLAFHERVVIDENDNVTHQPQALQSDGQRSLVDRKFIVENLLGNLHNFIGEPSNTMLVRERIDVDRVFDYDDWILDFLGDVAMFLNCSKQAPLVAVGGYLSAFRRHGAQASAETSANFSAGLYEWELMIRGEAADGQMSPAALAGARNKLRGLYSCYDATLPEIAPLLANLDELERLAPEALYTSPRFNADIAHARAAVAARVGIRRKGGRAAQQPLCVVCEQQVEGWLPHPQADQFDRTFTRPLETVGSTLQHHLCPRCGCNDRERHLWLYLAFSRVLEDASAKRILHIAPEAGIEPRIRRLQPREYVAGDLFPRTPQHHRIDVEQLDFPDGYFDLIICNHVLEHVGSPAKALAEFNRCLAPSGHLIAQTPYSPILRKTFELSKPMPAAFNVRYYGQDDHVRLFGADVGDQFRAAGFKGDFYPHTTVLGEIDAQTYGCNGREPFFFFAKGEAPSFAS
jgi:SAM-dependent methyltransferase